MFFSYSSRDQQRSKKNVGGSFISINDDICTKNYEDSLSLTNDCEKLSSLFDEGCSSQSGSSCGEERQLEEESTSSSLSPSRQRRSIFSSKCFRQVDVNDDNRNNESAATLKSCSSNNSRRALLKSVSFSSEVTIFPSDNEKKNKNNGSLILSTSSSSGWSRYFH